MPKIGVYICHCGHNIASVVDVEAVRASIGDDPDVAVARTNVFCCAEPGQKEIQQDIQELDLDHVLVAACSPRLHEPTFRRTIQDAGLNRYLLEMANIREHCSWVHSPESATEKALDLVRMAVKRLRFMEPLSDRIVPVTRRALVLGGGIAGLKAALQTADAGIPVLLLEKGDKLGGRAAEWSCSGPEEDPLSCFTDPLITRASLHPLIDLRLNTELLDIRGYIGNYTVQLRSTGNNLPAAESSEPETLVEESVGTLVVATGFSPYQPDLALYPYAGLDQVMTSDELERAFRNDEDPFLANLLESSSTKTVAFQQCVGSREPDTYPHCSRICCAITLKQALALRNLGFNVIVHHRDIRLYHKDQEENLYRAARRKGVIFQRGSILDVTAREDGRLCITAEDLFLGNHTTREVDRLILAVGLRPRADSTALRQTLKLAQSEDGFFLEAHPKLQPLETSVDGIYLAGTCQAPKDIRETVSGALGAAAKAYQILSKDQLELDGLIARIDPETCVGCGTCEEECPYQAIEMVPDDSGKPKARVLTAACKGCGVCAGCCPTGSADHLGYTEPALTAQLEETLRLKPDHKILAFCCNWCAYAGADSAGVSRLSYPAAARIIRIPCSGRVHSRLVIKAFQKGAARVLVAGCHPPGDCHYISGNLRFQERVPRIRRRLRKRGFNPDHFQLRWISATEGPAFQKTMIELAAEIEQENQGK